AGRGAGGQQPAVRVAAGSSVQRDVCGEGGQAEGGRRSGRAVDDKFMKVGDAHVVATELCLSAYNLQYFPSQPDQVVIVVLNDFDRAVGHIAETLVTYLSKPARPGNQTQARHASDASIPNIPDKPKVDRKGGADVEADDKNRDGEGPRVPSCRSEASGKMDDPWSGSRIRGVKWVKSSDPWSSSRMPDPWVKQQELDIRKPSSVFSVVVADCKECTVGLIRMDPKWFEFSQKISQLLRPLRRAIVKLEFSDSGKEFGPDTELQAGLTPAKFVGLTPRSVSADDRYSPVDLTPPICCVKDDGVMSIPATWKTDTFVSDKDNFVVSIEVRKGALSGESNMVNIVLNKATVHQFIVKSFGAVRGGSVQKKGKVSQTVHEGVFGYASCAKGKADDVGFYLLPDSASPVYSSVGGGPPGARLGEPGPRRRLLLLLKATRLSGRPLHTPPFRVLCHRMSSSSSAASSTAARIREGVAAELKRVRDQATASLEVEEKRLAESGGGGGGEFSAPAALVGAVRHGRAHPGLPWRRRIGDDLELFGTDQLPELPGGSGGHWRRCCPTGLWRIRHVKEALKAATEGSGRGRICAHWTGLKEADEKFGRRQLVEGLQWLHERLTCAASWPTPAPWSLWRLSRRSAEDERSVLHESVLRCAAGRPKALDWPLFTHAQLPAGSEPAALPSLTEALSGRLERALPRPVRPDQPARPAVPLLSLRLSAARMELAQTAGTESCTSRLAAAVAAASGKMSSAQRASTRQLLWSALHLFTDALDALLLRQGCLGVQVQSSADGREGGERRTRPSVPHPIQKALCFIKDLSLCHSKSSASRASLNPSASVALIQSRAFVLRIIKEPLAPGATSSPAASLPH
uniref:SHR-BD domain-containing protein n=1 Tax=Macrostomum lignano TaxID=282301 RepID=A0A1I8FPG0_9PLAT